MTPMTRGIFANCNCTSHWFFTLEQWKEKECNWYRLASQQSEVGLIFSFPPNKICWTFHYIWFSIKSLGHDIGNGLGQTRALVFDPVQWDAGLMIHLQKMKVIEDFAVLRAKDENICFGWGTEQFNEQLYRFLFIASLWTVKNNGKFFSFTCIVFREILFL